MNMQAMKVHQLIINTVTLYFIYVVSNQAEGAQLGCFEEVDRPRFFGMSPGNYNKNAMTPTLCKQQCSSWKQRYAALADGMYCFCAMSLPVPSTVAPDNTMCQQPCSGDGALTCGGINHVMVYDATPAIEDVQVEVTPSRILEVFKPGDFNITTLTGSSGFVYSMDFGDGAGDETLPSSFVSRAYGVPGEYKATATVSDSEAIIQPRKGAKSLLVQAPVKGVNLTCPVVWVSTVEFICNVTVISGSYVTLNVNYNDNMPDDNFPIADAMGFGAGPGVAYTPSGNSLANKVYVARESEFMYEGKLVAFEYHATGVGNVNFLLLRPTCGTGTYCHVENDCLASCSTENQDTCTATEVYCGFDVSCADSTTLGSCAAPVNRYASNSIQFTVVKAMVYNIPATGYGVLTIDPVTLDVPVMPGDVIGYYAAAGGGVLGLRTGGSDYTVNTVTSTAETNTHAITAMTASPSSVMFRGIATRPSEAVLYHTFGLPGQYDVVLTAANRFLPYTIQQTVTMFIEEGINFTIINNPEYGVTNEPVTFEVLPHTGSNVTYEWSFGEGPWLNVTQASRFFTYTYPSKGYYNVSARLYNRLMERINVSSIIIEDRILGMALVGTNAVTGQPYSITFSMTSGSDYNCSWTWGDGTSFTTDYIQTPFPGAVFTHTYPVEGWNTIQVYCYNNVSSGNATLKVLSIDPIVNIQLTKTGAIVGTTFYIEWNIDLGTNASWELWFDGNLLPISYDETTKHGKTPNSLASLPVGKYLLELHGTNPVSDQWLNTSFTIDRPIIGLVVTASKKWVLQYEAMTYDVTMNGGSSVIVTYSYKDGQGDDIYDTTQNGLVLTDWPAGTTYSQPHSFNLPGVYNTTVIVANNFNYSEYYFLVKVFNKVENLTLNSDCPCPYFPFLGISDVHVFFTSPTDFPTEAYIDFDWGDKSLEKGLVFQFPFGTKYMHRYTANGIYLINATVYNLVSSAWFTTTVKVLVPVVNLQLKVVPPHVVINTPVIVNAAMETGDDVTLYFDMGLGGGFEHIAPRTASTPYQYDMFSFIYTSEGIYKIRVIAANGLGNTTKEYEIHVQNPVLNVFTLTCNSPVTYTAGSATVTYTLTYPAGVTLPTDPYIILDPGDVLDFYPAPQALDLVTSRTLTFTHTYTKPSDYSTNFTIFNLASFITLFVDSGVYIGISGLACKALYEPLVPEGGPDQPGFGASNNVFPTHRPLKILCTLTQGTVSEYRVNAVGAGNTVSVISKTSPISVIIPQAGAYTVTVVSWNPMSSDSTTVNVVMASAIRGVVVSDGQVTTKPNMLKTFTVQVAQVGVDSCLVLDLGDKKNILVYGTTKGCTNYLPTGVTISGPIQTSFTVSNTYKSAGIYTLKANGYTDSVQATNSTSLTFVISTLDCTAPLIKISPNNPLFNEPVKLQRSKYHTINAQPIIDCQTTLENVKKWTIYQVDKMTGNDGKAVDVSSLSSSSMSTLVLPPLFLYYGVYHLHFTMTMKSGSSSFPSYAETYIEIVPSELLPALVEGSMSIVKRGYDSIATLDPGRFSLDPDLPPDQPQGLSFELYCRRTDEIFEYYRNGTIVKTNPSSFLTPAEQAFKIDNGGCAMSGPGYIVTNFPVVFNTNNMRENESYIFVLEVTKEVAGYPIRRATTLLQMDIVAGKPPSIVIECEGESQALCQPFPGGQLINPNNRIALKARCTDCQADMEPLLMYRWYIERQGLGGAWVEKNMTQYVQGSTSRQIAITSQMFSDDRSYFQQYMLYRIKVEAWWPMKATEPAGESYTVLRINEPPNSGQCSLDSTTVKVGDKSTLSATAWVDENGIDSINLVAFVGDTRYDLPYQDNALTQVILPFGNTVRVQCHIRDRLGAEAVQDMPPASVILDAAGTQTALDLFNSITTDQNTFLAKLTQEGEPTAILSAVSRLTAVLEAISATKLADLKVIMDAKTADLQAILNNVNSTQAQKDMAVAALETAAQEYQTLRDSLTQVRERMMAAVSILQTQTPAGLAAAANALSAVADNPVEISEEMQKVLYQKSVEMAESFSDLAITMPREQAELIAEDVATGLVNTLFTAQVLFTDPSLTDLERSHHSVNYFFDSDLESSQPDIETTRQLEGYAIAQDQTVFLNSGPQRKILDGLEEVTKGLASILINSEKPVEITIGSGDYEAVISARKEPISTLINTPLTQQGVSVVLSPDVVKTQKLVDGSYEDPVLSITMITSNTNPITSVLHGPSVNTPTMDLSIYDENVEPFPAKEINPPIDFFFEIDRNLSTAFKQTPKLPAKKKDAPARYFWYHSVNCKEYEGVKIRVVPDDPKTYYLVLVGLNDFPNCTMASGVWNCTQVYWTVLPNNNYADDPYMVLLNNEQIGNKSVKVIFGVRELNVDELTAYQKDPTSIPVFTNTQDNVFTKTYHGEFTCLGCYYFNPKKYEQGWHGKGLKTGKKSTRDVLHCQSNHLSLFGGGFSVQPNKIDWAFVFSHADFFSNPTLYIVELVTLLIFIVAVIWARHKDKKDKLKLGVTPLPDNNPDDQYLYEMVVYTGMRRNGGTESKVNFILSGEYDETDVRLFDDPQRKIFQRGAVDAFLLATPNPLGALNYMRVWHDNSGKGKYGSWYLKYVIISDLQTKEKYFFLCNRWLAVEEDDGMVDRLLAVAGKEQMTEFSHLFNHSTKKKLDDDHLWFSVVARPPQSRFTRVQRVCCCLLLLYTTMLANALFYGVADSNSGKKVFSVGPFALTPQQLYVGLICNLIVFPINFIVVFLFRKSRPIKKRPSRIVEALKQMKEHKEDFCKRDEKANNEYYNSHGEVENYPIATVSRPGSAQSQSSTTAIAVDPSVEKEETKKKFSLPWWCIIIAWALFIIGTGLSAAFVTFYGIMFQDEKCKKWLTSMLMSFVTSVFLTQPIQVLLMAALLSIVFKNPNLADDDGDEDEEDIELAADEAYLHPPPGDPGYAHPRKIAYQPPNPEALEKARQERQNERKMYAVLREIFFYFVFIWMLLVISYNFRDPNAFLIKESLVKTFVDKRGDDIPAVDEVKFMEMVSMKDFFDWANTMFVPGIRAAKWYNGRWLPGQRGFLSDRNNRIMGFATVRQLRIKPAKCSLVKPMDRVLKECNVPYAFYYEDKTTAGVGWIPFNGTETANNSAYEYVYRSATELDGFPYWATHHVYSGGGYVMELRGSFYDLFDRFKQLNDGGWFDHYTRAVFIEFTVYNVQVNIFTICTFVVEFLPTGSLFPSYRFEPVNLLGYSMGTAAFEIACQIVYFIYIIFFIITEAREVYKKRKSYFLEFWNWVEMSIIFLSVAGAVIFFYRLHLANKLTGKFKDTHGDEYMKFQYVGYWNELLLYMLGWLVFLATIKFLRLLRFNRRMSLLASTLRNSAQSMVNFALIFLIVFFAYVQFFYLLFFITIDEFSTFLVASETCLQMILGRFNFFEMKGANPTLGPLFFLAYVISVALILINMFVTILNEAFADVRDDVNKQMNDYEIVDFIVQRLKAWTGIGAVVSKSAAEQDEFAIKMTTIDALAEAQDCSFTFKPGFNPNDPNDMENFPDKVDRLVRYISNMYFPNKEWLEAIAIKKMEEKRKNFDDKQDPKY